LSGLRRALPLLLGLTASCAREPARGAQGPLALAGDGGRVVHLVRPARRVVSLNPTTTELLFAIGAGSQVVARTRWCDWPPAATRLPSVGDGFPPNVEAVLATHPDLAVMYAAGVNRAAAGRLDELGVPVLELRTDRLEDLARAARLLGAATGHMRPADSLATAIEAGLAAAKHEALAQSPGPRVVILAWVAPPLVLGSGSYLHEVVELAGGRNVFGDLARASGPASLEAIASRDPDLILTVDGAPSELLRRAEWHVVRAVHEGRVLAITDPALARLSPRAVAAIVPLRARLARIAITSPQELAR
jgi:iron complex transport system substrate-binding protein